jgi:hypothetical protein
MEWRRTPVVTSNRVCYYDKMPTTKPIDVVCPYCGARGGEVCRTPSGRDAYNFHSARTNPRLPKDSLVEDVPEPLQISRPRLPKKLKHRVRDRSHVWCDYHGEIHQARDDVYGDDQLYCRPDNWRRVYIETDDKTETF